MSKSISLSSTSLPLQHIAIICDGNRRWAREKGLPPITGHTYAFEKTFDNLVNKAIEIGLPYLTFWIFSTENWDRSKTEINWLMKLFRQGFKRLNKYDKQKVKFRHIGDPTRLPQDVQVELSKLIEKTKNNQGLTLTIAANYGGRDEVIRAVKKIVASGFDISKLNEKNFAQFLDTSEIPDPDFIIRTSGELRMSGFMTWQNQYSEFYFPATKFPDFDGEELIKAIEEFKKRQRRFGGDGENQ